MEAIGAVMAVLAGLSLVLLGITLLSRGMEKFAGGTMQKLIERLTSNRLKGFAVGFVSSAVMQSSSMVMVTMIGMINGGLMGLSQGVSVILGFEIGTTLTVQLISFDVGKFYLGVLALGFFLNYLSRRLKQRYLGQAILGVGILFLGITVLKEAMVPLTQEPAVIATLTVMARWPVLAVLAGMVITAIIHSSSATVSMAIALGAAGAISLPAAIAIGLGANIGTCITGFMASIGGTKASRQASIAQILVATTGMVVFLPLLNPFADFISLTAATLPRQIANAHTIHNAIVSLFFLPLAGLVVKIVTRIAPSNGEHNAMHVDETFDPKKDPDKALKEIRKELVNLGLLAKHMLEEAEFAFLNPQKPLVARSLKEVQLVEDRVDNIRYQIEKKLTVITGPKVTSRHSSERITLLHNSVDIERVADLALNLAEYASELAKASHDFIDEDKIAMRRMFDAVKQTYSLSLECIEKRSAAIARDVRAMEETIDDIDRSERKAHMERMESGVAKGQASAIFLEALRDLERMGDHADNIGQSLLSVMDAEITLFE